MEQFSRFSDMTASVYSHVYVNDDSIHQPRPMILSLHSGNGSSCFHISMYHAEQLADDLMSALDWVRESPDRSAAKQAETDACEPQERERPELDARTQILPAFLTKEAL